nr:Rho GTPase activating protein 19 [Hymenolepis microstoma]
MTQDFSGNAIYLTPVSKRVHEGVCIYANRLVATSSSVDNINLYRTRRTQKFVDLCKFHLSLLVDLPLTFNEYDPDSATSVEGIHKHRRYRSWVKLPQGSKYEILRNDWSEEQVDIYDNVVILMNHLSTGDNLKTEMIFRKTGNISRQRELCKLLNNGASVVYPVSLAALNASNSSIPPSSPLPSFAWSRMGRSRRVKTPSSEPDTISDVLEELTVHDYANALKTVLREMADPILTQDLLPVYISVSKLTSGNYNDSGFRVPLSPSSSRLARAKQIVALRILRFLLPPRNQFLLRRLLDLLTETLSYSHFNGMSAESLGTIFGPLLFVPSCRSSTDLHKEYDALNNLATLMIKQGSKGVFAIPQVLANDVDRNVSSEGLLLTLSASKDSGVDICSTQDDDATIYTDLTFAQQESAQEDTEAWKERTKAALNELSVAVKELPDTHPKKARYVRRFSNIYGGSKGNPLREIIDRGVPPRLMSPATSVKRSLANYSEETPTRVNVVRTRATLSSTSLDGSQVPCCPLAGMLPYIKRRQVRIGTPFRKVLESVKSPVFEEQNAIPPPQPLPQIKVTHTTPERKRVAVPVTVRSSRRNSCMRKLPVRRNYHPVKIVKAGCPSIPEIHSQSRRSM